MDPWFLIPVNKENACQEKCKMKNQVSMNRSSLFKWNVSKIQVKEAAKEDYSELP